MNTDRIDFISSYCDGWCERCSFTMRCSAYACRVAMAMCEDTAQALELAVGRPHPVDGEPEVPDADFDVENVLPTAEELAEVDRQERSRDARIRAIPLARRARAYSMRSSDWLNDRLDALRATADAVVAEALDVVAHDSYFVAAKLHRALDGRDRHQTGEEVDDHPVQNDWNGSAKIALISVERSELAWRTIAQATSDDRALAFADRLHDIRHLIHQEFSRAMEFVRPGFDEPWR